MKKRLLGIGAIVLALVMLFSNQIISGLTLIAAGAQDYIDFEAFITISEADYSTVYEIVAADLTQLRRQIDVVARGDVERREQETLNALAEMGMDIPAGTAIAEHAIRNFNQAISIMVEEQYLEVDEDGNVAIMTEDEIAAFYLEQSMGSISAQEGVTAQSALHEHTRTTGNLRQTVSIFYNGSKNISGIRLPTYYAMLLNEWLTPIAWRLTDGTSLFTGTGFMPETGTSTFGASLVYNQTIRQINGSTTVNRDLERILNATRGIQGISAPFSLPSDWTFDHPNRIYSNFRVFIWGSFHPNGDFGVNTIFRLYAKYLQNRLSLNVSVSAGVSVTPTGIQLPGITFGLTTAQTAFGFDTQVSVPTSPSPPSSGC
jgi:hypothetical protein